MYPNIADAGDHLANTRSTTGTIITVPAGRYYSGTISMSATVAVAGASNPVVVVNGTDAAPAAGTVLCRLNLAGLALSTISDTISTEFQVYASGGNDITLDFTAGANGTSSASVNGFVFG